MPFENTFCNREGCGHNVPDHPNDGECLKCNCVGFVSKNNFRDPLAEYYGRKIIDIHVYFQNDLDAAKHLVNDFPVMASKFFQDKKSGIDEYWTSLVSKNPDLAQRVNEKIGLFNQGGRNALESLERDEIEVVIKLTHDGANRDRTVDLMNLMVLSFLTTRFREFIRELLVLIYEIESKYKNKHQSHTPDELEKKAYEISEMDIKKMLTKLTNEWGLASTTNENCNQFTEGFYRRNVFIHNNGYPNQKYRDATGYKGSDDKLDLNRDYLLQLIEVLLLYSDIIYEYFLNTECGMVNINKRGNTHHIDLTDSDAEIIPLKDLKQ
ncbi:hypothetical protein [Candidatus Nitrosotenuis uzonensis]|uniref:Uncharacterized protein n=1 Tax=Candidatus Nitrosotenuis uzonensis TaxID=1407055 RepID=V6AQW3_9ARCH|nr:hypothetical protein [Candidatus Nitrosotenuis uzonensis]CDI04940.1 hypothetical protein NITUZ_140015 [Candidatus Nitrosotenuis uzonensis]